MSYRSTIIILFVMILSGIVYAMSSKPSKLQTGFVFLKDVDPTIIESTRYYTDDNFVGRKVKGYFTNKIICKKELADKLKLVNDDLKQQGYTLVVYDAYRPQEAVDDFVAWSKDLQDQARKEYFYPTLDKASLFAGGYIGNPSKHTAGNAVDVSIIESGKALKKISCIKRTLTNGEEICFLDDGTVDMGSSFDLFHEASHHDTTLINSEYLEKRNFLRKVMKDRGFSELKIEWWHFDLIEG